MFAKSELAKDIRLAVQARRLAHLRVTLRPACCPPAPHARGFLNWRRASQELNSRRGERCEQQAATAAACDPDEPAPRRSAAPPVAAGESRWAAFAPAAELSSAGLKR